MSYTSCVYRFPFAKTFLILAIAALSIQVVSAQHYVQDESYKDPTFVHFKIHLVDAILRKDTSKLFALVADEVHMDDAACSYGSKNCFKALFADVPNELNPVWDQLYGIVSQGFSRYTSTGKVASHLKKGEVVFQAPSYLKKFDDQDNTKLLVLGEYVNIRQQPTVYSKVLTRSTYEAMNYNDPDLTGAPTTMPGATDNKIWYEVVLPGNTKGYVREDYVSAGIKREMSVKKVNGKWKIISLYKKPLPGC